MRSIGNLPDEAQARRFGDYLVAQGIRNEVEPDSGAAWSVWIKEEDQVTAAQAGLEHFRANPDADEFRNAASAAAKTRAAVPTARGRPTHRLSDGNPSCH